MFSFVNSVIPFLSGDGQEHGSGHEEAGADFIMGHVLDHVVYEIHIFGLDLSITKHVIMMWIAAALLIITLTAAFRKPKMVPHGMANFFESIIVFLEDEILKPYLGEHSRPYAPYLLTAFFFIVVCNFLGLVPFGATATGNISVTAVLAVLTLIMVMTAGIRNHGFFGYLKGFIPPVPAFLLPLMIPVEIIGVIAKHFVLSMRLFANMTAGHVVIFTFLSIIFTFKNYVVGGITLMGIVAISMLEILIALIQAYIFTTLSAVFIGLAIHQEH